MRRGRRTRPQPRMQRGGRARPQSRMQRGGQGRMGGRKLHPSKMARGGTTRPVPRRMQGGGQGRRTHPHRFSPQTQQDNQHWVQNPGQLNQNLMGYRHHHTNPPGPPGPGTPYNVTRRRGGRAMGHGGYPGGCPAGSTLAADGSCIEG